MIKVDHKFLSPDLVELLKNLVTKLTKSGHSFFVPCNLDVVSETELEDGVQPPGAARGDLADLTFAGAEAIGIDPNLIGDPRVVENSNVQIGSTSK